MNRPCMNQSFWISLLLVLQWGMLNAMPAWAQTREDHIQAARTYMQENRWDYACYEWRAAIMQNPRRLEAHLGLAQAMMQAGLTQDAMQYLETLSPSLKNRPETQLLLGKVHQKAGHPKAASLYYVRVLARQPVHPVALGQIKQIMPALSPPDQQAARQVLQSQMDLARQKATDAYARQNYKMAAALYGTIARQTRSFKDINDFAISLLLSGDPRKAAQQFRLIATKAKDWHILSNASLVELGVGNHYRARKLIDQALSLCNRPADKAFLYNQLGYIYENGRKNTQALFAYEKAIELNPTFRKAHLNRAALYIKDQNYEAAIAACRQLLATSPQDAEILSQLGFAYELKNQYHKAIQAYQKAIAAKPDYKDAYYNLGTLYKKMGKTERANQAFKSMMELEFQAMETAMGPQEEAQGLASLTPNKQANLLKYVEVFTAHPMPPAPITANR